MDKKTIITLLVIYNLIIIGIVGYFAYNLIHDAAYKQGISDGQNLIIAEQTRTGSVFYFDVQANSTKQTSLQQLCTQMQGGGK